MALLRQRCGALVWLAVAFACWGLVALAAQPPAPAATPSPTPGAGEAIDRGPVVVLAEVDGIVHPVLAEFMMATIDRADLQGAALVVFTLRTPGGLLDATRDIISRMIKSRTPVAIWVGPSGARAASAGFLLTIAADVAAMAPGTSIGAAHPVSGDGQPQDQTLAKKAASDVAAYARTLAASRGRNVELAELAVTESRAYTDAEARKATPPLVDLTAKDMDDLLAQLDGRAVTRFDGSEVILDLKGARREVATMTWRQRLLSTIAHPQIAYLLFSLGTLGLTIELWNPGSILPGVVGGICLLLAFFAFQVLPVNLAGLLLILFGLLLLVLEVKVASFGMLAVGGIAGLVLGALMLYDSSLPELRLGLQFVLPVAGGFAAVILFLVRLAVQSQRRRAVTGDSGMVGERGLALTAIPAAGNGQVSTHGEIWRATATEDIAQGERIEVVAVEGLTAHVRRVAAANGGRSWS